MTGISIERAHQLLGLSSLPSTATIPTKRDIQQAYRRAAQRYHPDARFPHSTPCAVQFRQCTEARLALMRYYYQNPGIQMRRAARRTNASSSSFEAAAGWNPSLQHLKYKKYTMGLKFMVLLVVACEGVVDSWSKRKQ